MTHCEQERSWRMAEAMGDQDVHRDANALLTLDETAAFLRISKATASKLTRGKIRGCTPLPSIRLGRRVLVRREDLFLWLSTSTSGTVLR
jgi:hypothetical protein